MPYIRKKGRANLDPTQAPDSGSEPLQSAVTAGELNFQITRLVDRFISDRHLGYDAINTAIGVLECAKLELYRRVAAPYEDRKMTENGDVYT